MTLFTRRGFVAAAGAAMLPIAGPSRAAAYPDQTVKIIVPFSAGSMTDILARSIADRLQTRWKQSVVVENRAGIPGASSVAKATGDGYTFLLTSNGHVVLGAISKNLNFDPIGDFQAVAQVAITPSILIAPATGNIDSVQKLIAEAKAKPGELSYASAGVASSTGIAAELFKSVTGTQLSMVAYRGLPEANTSVLRGDTAMGFTFFNVSGDLIQSGKLRALAVTGEARLPQLPDVPTFKEAGIPGFSYDAWFGMLAPNGTPGAIVDLVAKDVSEEIGAADLKARFQAQGVELRFQGPAEFAKTVRGDAERYRKLVQAASTQAN